MDLLEKLVRTAGVAGREHRVRQLITEMGSDLFDEMHTDALGSLHGVRRPRPGDGAARADRPPRIMIAAHMDQIGFLVRHIDDRGFLRVQNVGGFDVRNLFARLVTVCTESGDLPGVLNPATKPVHIATDEERKKTPEMSDFVVDLGLPGDEVHEKVRIGDVVVLQAPMQRVGRTVVAQALDNRVSCYWLLESLRALEHHAAEIHAVFTVQEEVGCRGAGPAAARIQPDYAVVLDTTLCVDTPGIPEEQRQAKQGAGVGLMIMDSGAINDIDRIRAIERLAAEREIRCQRTVLARGGTDARTIQLKDSGYPTLTLVCPTRYIHTVVEMIHEDDLDAAVRLLTAWLGEAT